MNVDKLEEINQVLALKFRKRQTVFAQIVAEETRIRAQISKLDGMATQAEDADHTQMKMIGADVIWKAWVNRTKTSLNLELAKVLAQKDQLLSRVQKDYGRLLVSEQLVAAEKKTQRREMKKRMLDSAINSYLFRE